MDDVNPLIPGGPGHGFFGFFWGVGAFLGGLVLTAAIVVLAILLVRYLIVATRAAQIYVDAHTPDAPGATTTTTAPAATEPPPATKPAPRPRTPKTPPAV